MNNQQNTKDAPKSTTKAPSQASSTAETTPSTGESGNFRITTWEGPEMIAKTADTLARLIFGRTRTEAHALCICVKCAVPAHATFRNELDGKEYRLSGFCTQCQDKIFNRPSDDALAAVK